MNMPPEKVAVLVITGVIAILVSVTLLNSPERVDRDRERVWADSEEFGEEIGSNELIDPDELREGKRRTRVTPPKRRADDVDVRKPRRELRATARHTIRRNETLSSISKKYYGDQNAWPIIKQANPGLSERRLKPGLEIVIPDLAGKRRVGRRPSTRRPAAGPAAGGGRWYVVRSGESLARIAKREYGVERRWKQIYAANRSRLRSENSVREGQRIFLPVTAR